MLCQELRLVLSVVFYVVNENPQNRICFKSCKQQTTTPEIRRFHVLFWIVLTKKMQGESLVLQRFLNFKLYIPVSLKSPLAHSKQTYTESLPLQQFMKNLCRFTGI